MTEVGSAAPTAYDPSRPNIARVYDYLLGGKANFNGNVAKDMRTHRGARPRGRVDMDAATYGPRPAYQPPED